MAFEDRAKLFLSEQGRVLSLVLAIAGVLCILASGYIFLTPVTETVTDQVDQETFATNVETSAIVTRNSTLYERGTQLQNRSAYFTTATPNLTLAVRTKAPADEPATLRHQLTVAIVGLRDGRSFFEQRRTLIEQEGTVTDGTFSSEETINISSIRQGLREKQEEVGGVGQFQIRILLNVSYKTDSYQGTLTENTSLILSGNSYYLEQPLQTEQTRTTTNTDTVQRSPTMLEYGGIGVLGTILFALSAVVVRISRMVDPESLRVNIVHDSHQEWISKGEFPTESNKQYISILTLDDLVDVAIDSSRRVIYDPDLDAYAVIDGDEIYYYAQNVDDTDMWLEM